jgi:hypothetical protein
MDISVEHPADSEAPAAPSNMGSILSGFRKRQSRIQAAVALASFLLGSFSGYFVREQQHTAAEAAEAAAAHAHEERAAKIARQINPPEGYTLPAAYGTIGPSLLAAGAFDYDVFVQLYAQAGQPLTEQELQILKEGSSESITITEQNAYFLLNLFWALGLTNRNPILTEGPIVQNSGGEVEGFASTGGWTIAAKPLSELYASVEILNLSPGQQQLVEKVAQGVFRPCCNNSTHFPDCNHGMAMLGLLQLMAAQGANEAELYEAAKYVNAFWYPAQNQVLAAFFQAVTGEEFAAVEPAVLVSGTYSSGSGFQTVHQWVAQNGLLEQSPAGKGGGCGV